MGGGGGRRCVLNSDPAQRVETMRVGHSPPARLSAINGIPRDVVRRSARRGGMPSSLCGLRYPPVRESTERRDLLRAVFTLIRVYSQEPDPHGFALFLLERGVAGNSYPCRLVLCPRRLSSSPYRAHASVQLEWLACVS